MTETNNTITTNLDGYKAVFFKDLVIQYGTTCESMIYVVLFTTIISIMLSKDSIIFSSS